MVPVGSFYRMEYTLQARENKKGTDIPITVGILISDYHRQFCRENIINQLEYYDAKSGELIDFYIPGYCKREERVLGYDYIEAYRFRRCTYYFSQYVFNEFVEELEKRDVTVTGHAQLLLVPYENGKLLYHSAKSFDLENEEGRRIIESTKLFFDSIFKIAGETTDFTEFEKQIARERNTGEFKRKINEFLKGVPIDVTKWLLQKV